MQCPECVATHIRKNGKKKGKQNHICGECGRQFIDHYDPPSGHRPPSHLFIHLPPRPLKYSCPFTSTAAFPILAIKSVRHKPPKTPTGAGTPPNRNWAWW